jgi:hypothetical protein
VGRRIAWVNILAQPDVWSDVTRQCEMLRFLANKLVLPSEKIAIAELDACIGSIGKAEIRSLQWMLKTVELPHPEPELAESKQPEHTVAVALKGMPDQDLVPRLFYGACRAGRFDLCTHLIEKTVLLSPA